MTWAKNEFQLQALLQLLNADSEEDLDMISQTNVPIMKKAVNVIYDMSEDTRLREMARMREKALHDEASALKNAVEKGIAIGSENTEQSMMSVLKDFGMTEEQINEAILKSRLQRGNLTDERSDE